MRSECLSQTFAADSETPGTKQASAYQDPDNCLGVSDVSAWAAHAMLVCVRILAGCISHFYCIGAHWQCRALASIIRCLLCSRSDSDTPRLSLADVRLCLSLVLVLEACGLPVSLAQVRFVERTITAAEVPSSHSHRAVLE